MYNSCLGGSLLESKYWISQVRLLFKLQSCARNIHSNKQCTNISPHKFHATNFPQKGNTC